MKDIERFEFIEENISANHQVGTIPNLCPICHTKISPEPVLVYDKSDHRQYVVHGLKEILFLCPNRDCNELFIGYYRKDKEISQYQNFSLFDIKPLNFKDYVFEEEIENTSKDFVDIYNQAYKAEQIGLNQICGVGYRKALEFLIKDYLVIKVPDEKEKILKALLMNCIVNWVDDDKIKSVAKRAVWLGNDETHYLRKWADKDVNDLKLLIRLTVHWITMETLTTNYVTEMPEDKIKK